MDSTLIGMKKIGSIFFPTKWYNNIFGNIFQFFFFSEQTSLEILLDANIPVLCESINVSTAGMM